jgi:hypothetical protein
MFAMPSRGNLLSLSLLTAFIIVCAGCTVQTNPEAVLAGTWTLLEGTTPDTNLTQVLLNFDDQGGLVSVTYVFLGVQATNALTDTTTLVSGNQVTITSSGAGFTVNFTGTLNAADTMATGTASWALTILNSTITSPLGSATLVKGVANAANGQTTWNAQCISCHNGTIAPTAANSSPGAVVNSLGSIDSSMNGITLTNQEVADIQAYLASQ